MLSWRMIARALLLGLLAGALLGFWVALAGALPGSGPREHAGASPRADDGAERLPRIKLRAAATRSARRSLGRAV